MNEIKIIGGGLTGLSLGIALRKLEVPVTLHEASQYPRHKVCGEFINGVKKSTLDYLGISPLFESALRHSKVDWFYKNKKFYSFKLSSPALAISRYSLDEMLAETFQDMGGELFTGSRMKAVESNGNVFACGRRLEKESHWIGLKSHFSGLDLHSDLEMHIGNNCYLGLCRIEENKVNACGLFRKSEFADSSKGINLLNQYLIKNGLNALAERLGDADPVEGAFKGVSAFSLGAVQKHEERLVLGDYHSIIPPFTGNGMSMALESAEVACNPLAKYANGEDSWPQITESIKHGLNNKFKTRMRLSGWIHPLFFSNIGQRLLYYLGSARLIPMKTLSHFLK